MQMRQALAVAVAGVGFCLSVASPVHASSITLSGGTAGTVPVGAGANDFLAASFFTGGQTTIGGYYGSQVNLTSPGTYMVTIDFYGAQADFHNEFDFGPGSVELFDHPGGGLNIALNLASPKAHYVGTFTGSGAVPFRFDVNSDASTLSNGSNVDNSAQSILGPNFLASCNPFGSAAGSGGTTCDTVFIFLDDSGGGPDNDYDDFLVRMTVQTAPEPASLLLVTTGIAAARALRRRQRI